MTLQKLESSKLNNPLWPYNLIIDMGEKKSMISWLKECHGHGDIYHHNGIWLSQETGQPINVEARYFFWGDACVQFKYEDALVAFVLRFDG